MACDVTVLPSLFEGTPNVLIESMSCVVPVVATPVSDNAYVVPEGEVGYLVGGGEEAALADRIRAIPEDEPRRRRLSAKARAWIEAEFSTARPARETEDVYRDALRGRPAEPSPGPNLPRTPF